MESIDENINANSLFLLSYFLEEKIVNKFHVIVLRLHFHLDIPFQKLNNNNKKIHTIFKLV